MNYKNFFFALLFINVFLGWIFSIYYFQQVNDELRRATLYIRPPIHQTSKLIKSSPNSVNAIDAIKNLLEVEYDKKDLLHFYSLTERELTVGLHCTRVENQSQLNLTKIRSFPKKSRRTRNKFYSFSLNNSIEICSDEPIDLLIMVISKSDNYKTRDAIRRTWGSGKNLSLYSNIRLKVLFFLDFDAKLSENIQLEQNLFEDIVQVKLPQQYTLVTQRVLSLLEWSLRFCRQAKFVFKTDDDIFINIILLLKFISLRLEEPIDKSFRPSKWNIYGYLIYNSPAIRESDDRVFQRYVVTRNEFPCNVYPTYLSGFGYLIPKKARDALIYAAYHDTNQFRISDVYVTGILSDYLSITRQNMLDYSVNAAGVCDSFFNQSKTAFACAIGEHFGDSTDVFVKFNQFWQLIQNAM